MDRYSTFFPRFWAGLVDSLVLLPVILLDNYLSSPSLGALTLITWAVTSSTALCLYSILMHAHYGQTLGKMAAHVKVLDVSETKLPSLRQVFLRDIGDVIISLIVLAYFIYLVSTHRYVAGAEDLKGGPGGIFNWLGFTWFLLELITMLTNEKRRAVHDLIAGTVVVRLNPVRSWETDLQES